MKLCANELAFLALQGWGWETITIEGVEVLQAQVAIAVCYGESGGDPYAIGQNIISEKDSTGSQDLGLWQINNYWHGAKLQALPQWRDPWAALALAVQCHKEAKGVWKPWHAFTGGGYKSHWQKAYQGLRAPFWALPAPSWGWRSQHGIPHRDEQVIMERAQPLITVTAPGVVKP